jgi:hypothetical protein
VLALGAERSPNVDLKPLVVFGVLALVLALRIMHWSNALQSPLSYQPGPDEDYYQRFGAAVAEGRGADTPEFTFMDPGYGYLLGAAFKLFGINTFVVYLLQALLDTATAYGILIAGQLLGRSREGLIGALLYGLTSTAIMFTAALLKETCVASFLIWWVVAALVLVRGKPKLAWAAFGVYCGLGIALRSTLLVIARELARRRGGSRLAHEVGTARLGRGDRVAAFVDAQPRRRRQSLAAAAQRRHRFAPGL